MEIIVDVILKAGRSAVELSLFILLPVMVVMLSLMRLLEAKGVLDWLVAKLAPLLKPFGLTGLGVFAALQINFVSFAAPIATLTMMDQRGASGRHIAATLAMVTVEEHSVNGGLGEACAAYLFQQQVSLPFRIMAIPDEYTVTGSQLEIFEHYGISEKGIASTGRGLLEKINIKADQLDSAAKN